MSAYEAWLYRDLHEQLGNAVDTLITLSNRCRAIKDEMTTYVVRGEGLTQDELIVLHAKMDKVFGGRKRTRATTEPPTTLDTPL